MEIPGLTSESAALLRDFYTSVDGVAGAAGARAKLLHGISNARPPFFGPLLSLVVRQVQLGMQ